MNLADKMRAAPERGTPCCFCATSAKDCQIRFVESTPQRRCCLSCDQWGGGVAHRGATNEVNA